jgi:hypothetical protein
MNEEPKFSSTFLLLQNEGFLMQGCLKSAIVALKADNSAERGPLYVAFFNFSLGLERLLKLVLALNHCAHNNGKMPSRKTLKDFGHDVAELYRTSEKLLASWRCPGRS